ncbi:hypothetical protein L1887_04770 [Cichorium endivia]|nr:hypothetical protein L1887_04770 [Cichorium endivia]
MALVKEIMGRSVMEKPPFLSSNNLKTINHNQNLLSVNPFANMSSDHPYATYDNGSWFSLNPNYHYLSPVPDPPPLSYSNFTHYYQSSPPYLLSGKLFLSSASAQ